MTLKLIDINKNYGKQEILKDINLTISNGVYGLLGPNGVGKSTLFNIISGYISPDSGKIIYPEIDPRKEILMGVLPQVFIGYPEMTILEFLEYIGSIKSNFRKSYIIDDINEKLSIFNIENIKKQKIKKLSGGQLRRVGLAQAFLLNPRIILLDEPSVGLDPKERIYLNNYIGNKRGDQIIFISTHIVPDLEEITDKVFILKDKNFVEQGSEADLIRKLSGKVWEIDAKNLYSNKALLEDIALIRQYKKEGQEKLRVISKEDLNLEKKAMIPTLEDLYLFHFSGGER